MATAELKGSVHAGPRGAAAGDVEEQLVVVVDGEDAMLTWRLWQLVDSSFPTGAFAHSGGLEAASHVGLLPAADVATLEAWLAAQAARSEAAVWSDV